jgi:CAAD domains of cyanobacterial aminoacyl-tRNA synthetase
MSVSTGTGFQDQDCSGCYSPGDGFMNPEVKESNFSAASAPDFAEPAPLTINSDEPLLLSPANESQMNVQVKQVVDRVKTFIESMPDYLAEFFSEYKRPLTVLALLFGGFVTFKMTLALLDAVDDIPLLAPTFELIGFGYTAWFVYRYLLKASTRKELSTQVDDVKDQIVGKLNK